MMVIVVALRCMKNAPRVIEANLGKAEIQQKVRNCQVTVNKRFKN
jgi:hypothetical protein